MRAPKAVEPRAEKLVAVSAPNCEALKVSISVVVNSPKAVELMAIKGNRKGALSETGDAVSQGQTI